MKHYIYKHIHYTHTTLFICKFHFPSLLPFFSPSPFFLYMFIKPTYVHTFSFNQDPSLLLVQQGCFQIVVLFYVQTLQSYTNLDDLVNIRMEQSKLI